MKYIIMCGGVYQQWTQPKQLLKVGDETVVERTIRLLREKGVQDISISTNNPLFDGVGVPILHHDNSYNAKGYNNFTGYWCDGFYPMDEPVCYLFGDVIFSPHAINTIVDTLTNDIEFFASSPPFPKEYNKQWAEPFALKVVDNIHLEDAKRLTKLYADANKFYRKPIMWELWQVIKGTPLNVINYSNYTVINDYTCDIDEPSEIQEILEHIKKFDK